MAKTIASGSLGNYELRAVDDGLAVKLQQRELGGKRFSTRHIIHLQTWQLAVSRHSEASGAFFDFGMPK